ncbi:MAG: ABC transporter permease [Pseudomonadota bacterium]|nr:ABC transporter permease [Pseudomonadota bacterium]
MLTFRLAVRNLFRNTRRTMLTMLMIGFSVSALILVDAITQGMLRSLTDTFTKTLTGEAQVLRAGYSESFDVDLYISNVSDVEALLSRDAAIAATSPRVMTGGMIASSYNVISGMTHGIDPLKETDVSRLDEALVAGEFLRGSPLEILIGTGMQEILEVDLGDRIVVTTAVADTGELTQALFRVSGIFQFGIRDMDDSFAFINIADAQSMLGMNDAAHQIIVQFHDPDTANLPLQLATDLSDWEQTEIYSWMTLNREIASMLEMSSIGTVILGSILFLLVSFGVVNSMFMSVYERIYEIGVIKAVGTRPFEIIRLILMEAFVLGFASCLFGGILASLVGFATADSGIPLGQYEISGVALNEAILPVLTPSQFVTYPIYTTLLTMLAAVYPAVYASRIAPSEALRKSL